MIRRRLRGIAWLPQSAQPDGAERQDVRVVLINPPITSRERYGRDMRDIGAQEMPMGLCSLAAVAEQRGDAVCIIDAEAWGLDNRAIVERVLGFRADVCGVTSTTVTFPRAASVAAAVKAARPDLPMLIGGCHATADPEGTVRHECFDYAVLWEGEHTFLELTAALAEGRDPSDIPNLAYMRDGEVRINPRRPYIENLDGLPLPSYHLLERPARYRPSLGGYRYEPVVSVITSRGCPFRCIYCDRSVFGHRYRATSAGYVEEVVGYAVRALGAREIAFLDDTFTVDNARTFELAERLRRRRPRVAWTCMTRVDLVSKEMLRAMKASGCWQIAIGVESGNQEVLDALNKRITLAQVRDAARWATEAGIALKGYFMIGCPKETQETIADTIRFARSIPLTDAVMMLATPIPKTEFRCIAPQHGQILDVGWDKFSYWDPVFIPHGLTAADLVAAHRQFFRRFYFRPEIVFRQLRKCGSFAQLWNYAWSAFRVALSLWRRRRDSVRTRRVE